MAKKKAAKSSDEPKAPKAKGLFDHINEIRVGRNPDYFNTLTDADKKSWSNFMVCRFLSMQPEIIEYINDLQHYQDKLSPSDFYRLCLVFVPRGRAYFPYIKSQAEKHNKDLLSLLCTHFQESERNILEYLSILPRAEIASIVRLYGYSEKDSEKLLEA